MSDLISRQAAIDALEKLAEAYRGWDEPFTASGIDVAIDAIKEAPSADRYEEAYWDGFHDAERANHRWIPVSERLPSEDGRYLATYPLMRGKNWIGIKWFGKPNMPNRPIKGKCFYESDSEYGDVIWDNVIAWMPLPEPWKGDEA